MEEIRYKDRKGLINLHQRYMCTHVQSQPQVYMWVFQGPHWVTNTKTLIVLTEVYPPKIVHQSVLKTGQAGGFHGGN